MPLLALITVLRKHPNSTQRQLRDWLGVSQSTLSADLRELHVASVTIRNDHGQRVKAYRLALPPEKKEAIRQATA